MPTKTIVIQQGVTAYGAGRVELPSHFWESVGSGRNSPAVPEPPNRSQLYNSHRYAEVRNEKDRKSDIQFTNSLKQRNQSLN